MTPMNGEMQTLIERIEMVERQNLMWKVTAGLALVASLAALAMPMLKGAPVPHSDRGLFSVVEANRFLLRDHRGAVAGGIESAPDGTLRLVLGGRGTPSAHLVVSRAGGAQLTLRAADGRVRAGVAGSDMPSVWLAPSGGEASAALLTQQDGGGRIVVRDAAGRARFRAP